MIVSTETLLRIMELLEIPTKVVQLEWLCNEDNRCCAKSLKGKQTNSLWKADCAKDSRLPQVCLT